MGLDLQKSLIRGDSLFNIVPYPHGQRIGQPAGTIVEGVPVEFRVVEMFFVHLVTVPGIDGRQLVADLYAQGFSKLP